jgi:hypothetical protein
MPGINGTGHDPESSVTLDRRRRPRLPKHYVTDAAVGYPLHCTHPALDAGR